MRVVKKLLIGVAAVLVILVAVAYLLPRRIQVDRSTVIGAPPATVFAVLNGYRLFNAWSPWYESDPEARFSYDGPTHGVGAKMSWASDNPDVGSGTSEIVESRPHEFIKVALDFGPEGKADATYRIEPDGEGTRVTWGFDTDLGNNPVGRCFGLLLEGMIAPDFEKGLAGLKKLVEALPAADFAGLKVEHVTVEPVTVAYRSTESSTEDAAIAAAIGAAYGQVVAFMGQNRLAQAGPPLTINTSWGKDDRYAFDAAIPISGEMPAAVPADSPVQIRETYAGPAVKTVHVGPYHGLEQTYDRLYAWIHAHGYEAAGDSWDEFVSDPGATPEPELITNIYVPVE